jgi:DNA-directed RNA polymerase subunit K/omega
MLTIERPAGSYTKYERARLIGARALQISQGAPILVKLSAEEMELVKFNPVEIAKREFDAGVLPLDVKR